jgi:GNAT superfamily N-acetyltransferase
MNESSRPRPRHTGGMQPTLQPLSPATLPDLLAFFDGDAFSDNPKWASCYCQCFYEDHRVVTWSERTAEQNRTIAIRRGNAGAMKGTLAVVDGQVVGWCNAAPRALLHALDEEPLAEAATIGCILCFLVAPALRGQGVATALLHAACDGLRAQGMKIVEANPRTGTNSASANHYGPLAMYLAAGFVVDRESDDGSVWVRKSL